MIQSSLFDAFFYISKYADVANADIEPFRHYVHFGRQEGRHPSIDFDPAEYLAANRDLSISISDAPLHYVNIGRFENRARSRREAYILSHYKLAEESGLFDAVFYRKMLPSLPSEQDPLRHYLITGSRFHLDPSPEFDAVFYASQNRACRLNETPPLIDYLLSKKEGQTRAVVPDNDFHWINEWPDPDEDVHIERLRRCAFEYRHGIIYSKNMSTSQIAFAIDDLSGRTLPNTPSPTPFISIIIPVYGQISFVLSCLDSLARHKSRYNFEIIIMDDASPEETGTGFLEGISWIRYIRSEQNLGFIGACNFSAQHARGEYLVFLNSDTRVCSNWLDELIGTFEDRPRAGFVGSKLFYEDGTLQEAGAIVWRDGSAWNFGRNDEPGKPQYCYARQVDYCSGAAIAVPRQLWNELGGFDTHYLPAYYEDVDFAFKVRAAGYEVWYQPLARVLHFEGKSHGIDETKGVKAFQVVNARKFATRWAETLKDHRPNGELPMLESDRSAKLRMLTLDAVAPSPDKDAGSIMTIKLLNIFQKLGWHVSFIATHNPVFDYKYTADLQRAGIETFQLPQFQSIDSVMTERREFDVVLGFRVTALGPVYDRLRNAYPSALIMFHDIDLHYLRMQREAELKKDSTLARKAELVRDEELNLIAQVDCTIVPSDIEKHIIVGELGVQNVLVYPYTADVIRSATAFGDRHDIVFVGGYAHSPNVDAVEYFVRAIWPELQQRLPQSAKFRVVGAGAPDSLRELASDRIILDGFVEDLAPLLDQCRVFVAPLRYGAGLKGKVVTALSHGVPCVASSIAIEGMGLTDRHELLVADKAADFIERVIQLYEDEALWTAYQEAGYGFVTQHYSWESGMAIATEALKQAEATWFDRARTARAMRSAEVRAIRERGENGSLSKTEPS
ncbi:glycosyltransferase [Xanthobacter sp. DSM 24535]|uniref:glycosyltransferase n=1 Tax=Roseixanthobacter psychrophilus TaxID=3119917 RepID=UPI003728103C